jgi:hypothetical protein
LWQSAAVRKTITTTGRGRFMFCDRCKNINEQDAKYCVYCGHDMKAIIVNHKKPFSMKVIMIFMALFTFGGIGFGVFVLNQPGKVDVVEKSIQEQ